MIEDLQDELPQEQPKKKERPFRRGLFLFVAFMVWIIYAAAIILFTMPRMIAAVRESGIAEIIDSYDEINAAVRMREVRLCFVIPGSDGSSTYVICSQKTEKTGASEYHDIIEGLLRGPGKEALSIGAITFIARDTTLLGLTISEETAFVNLSESFTGSGSSWGPGGLDTACRQITATLQAYDPAIRKVVILVDGKELSV
ncbi:MAG: GerMN domain-containing protein [Spirochaetales bacterium]|nr:GerMN domain-containing protein [Spirochaetales bacterium]